MVVILYTIALVLLLYHRHRKHDADGSTQPHLDDASNEHQSWPSGPSEMIDRVIQAAYELDEGKSANVNLKRGVLSGAIHRSRCTLRLAKEQQTTKLRKRVKWEY